MTNLEKFLETYHVELERAVRENPTEYMWPLSQLETVFGRIRVAIERQSFNKDSHAFRATCRILKIKHTYKAIQEYITEVQS